MNHLTTALNATRPFIQAMALLAAFLTAWSFACELLPVLRQVFAPKVATQTTAIVAAALALVGGRS